MRKIVAGLILRPQPVRTGRGRGSVALRFVPAGHRRELRPAPAAGPVISPEAEALFCEIAENWLYATHGQDADYPGGTAHAEAALIRWSDRWDVVMFQLPTNTDYLTVLFETQHYADSRLAWARRTGFPLFRREGGTLVRNPPPKKLDDPGYPMRRVALAILQDAVKGPQERRSLARSW